MEQNEVSQIRKDVPVIELGPADDCNVSEYHRPCFSNNFPSLLVLHSVDYVNVSFGQFH